MRGLTVVRATPTGATHEADAGPAGGPARSEGAGGCPVDRAPAEGASPRTGARGERGRALGREASGFIAAGAFGLVVDVGGYNALVHLGEDGLLDDQPLVAKTISLVAGTTVAYVGNRFWTYRDRPRGRLAREYSLYMALSAVALLISLVCLAFSRYVLDLRSPVADNVAANVVGLVLGSLFRFLTYRRYVFPDQPAT